MKAVASLGPENLSSSTHRTRRSWIAADAIVRVSITALCGADLFPYHGYVAGVPRRHDPRPRVRRRGGVGRHPP